MNEKILKMENISKSFPGVKALSNVNFSLNKGEIHALMGENGAGKSTLIKVLTGVEIKDSGSIYLNDKQINPKSTQEAQKEGIATVYQEVNLCPNLSVAENLFIGRELITNHRIDWKAIENKSKEILSMFNLEIDVTKTLSSFSVAVQQMIAIARAVDISAEILILDEPTSSLSLVEVNELFVIMRMLKGKGVSIIFVTHFLDQVYEICDRISVLRNGEYVGTYLTSKLNRLELVGKMIGKEFHDFASEKNSLNDIKLEKECFYELDDASTSNIRNISLKVNKNEVLGFSGLLGSGRSETAHLIFASDQKIKGKIKINGHEVEIKNPLNAIRSGIAFCPEDRKVEGIVPDLSIEENIILALQSKKGVFKKISREDCSRIADEYIKLLSIKTPNNKQLIKNLSGGNQQKVILARWLATNPKLLMLDEPTRGIDINTKGEIQKIVIDLASKGMALVFISSEIDEMTRCCSRLIVLKDKRQVGELKDNEITEQNIMRYMAKEDIE